MIIGGTDLKDPLWMTAAVDQRLAKLDEVLGEVWPKLKMDVVLTHLTDPDMDTDEAFEKWNHTCDHCGFAAGSKIVCGTVEVGHRDQLVAITFGACPECLGLA